MVQGAIFIGGLLAVAGSAFGQTWTQTSAPLFQGPEPYYIAASADGSRLILAYSGNSPGPIFTSTNSGSSWVSNNMARASWSAVASSADGTRLAAAVYGGGIYTSTDAGSSWHLSGALSADWVGLASSGDGRKLFAAIYGGDLYYSMNSGTNWSDLGLHNFWNSVACSAAGAELVAAVRIDDPPTYVSTNSGISWVTNTTIIGQPQSALFSTATGDTLFLMTAGFLYKSTNFGVAWTRVTEGGHLPPAGGIDVGAISANGNTLVGEGYAAAGGIFSIYTSFDGGADFVSNSAPATNWTAFAASADGNKLFAACPAGVYTRQDVLQPNMNSASSSNGLAISWTLPSTNFVLQENSDLTATNWVTLTNTPTLNLSNLNDEVVLPLSNSVNFFRLVSQ